MKITTSKMTLLLEAMNHETFLERLKFLFRHYGMQLRARPGNGDWDLETIARLAIERKFFNSAMIESRHPDYAKYRDLVITLEFGYAHPQLS